MLNYRDYLLVFVALVIFFLLSATSMKDKSATFDEPVHLAAGYSYLKTGDYRLNIEHPPLMKILNALPLLLLAPKLPRETLAWREARQWLFGEEFVYRNRIDADKLLFAARISTILVAAFLGFFVFKFARELYGLYSGLFALFLFVFCPNILANSQMVTTDMAATTFIFLSVYSFWKFLHQPNKKNIILSGIALGCALASKFTTVIIFPIYLFIWIFYIRKNKKVNHLKLFLGFLGIGIVAFFILSATYQFTGTETYISGLRRIIAEAGRQGHESFLLGRFSNTGWRHYYIVAFLLKTPLPLIFSIVLWAFLVAKKKISISSNYALLIAVFFIFLIGSFSKKQLGLRYILPVYPFIFVCVSQILKWDLEKKIKIMLFSIIGVIYLYSNLKVYPHYLSYFNELAGGPDSGWKYLTNSNIDWGQDLKGLKKYIDDNKVSDVILSYYGITDPHYYKIDYQDLVVSMMFNRTGRINSLEPQKEILAISVNNLQSAYFYDKQLFQWLKERKPDAKIGYSIFVYDITDDLTTNEYLAQIYHNSGWRSEARRHCLRLLSLDSENPVALFTLACICADEGNSADAIRYFNRFVKSRNPEFLPIKSSLINYGSYQLKASRPVEYDGYYRSFFHLGEILLSGGFYEQAITVYKKITVLYPDSADAYYNLGLAYKKANRTYEAENAHKIANELRSKAKLQN